MARTDRLTVILPDALPRLRMHHQEGDLSALPALRSLLDAGELSAIWSATQLNCARLDPWQISLLHTLGVEAHPAVWASGALCWRADGGIPSAACLHAEPVYFAAGMDSLQLFPVADLDLEQAQGLFADLQASLAAADFELKLGQSGHWYAICEAQLDLVTYSPRSSFAGEVYEIMPRGGDGPRLRRLMTELQMLLHEHPVNRQRERQGQKPVNAVWFWGAGQLNEMSGQVSPRRVSSEQVYVRGLCDYLKLDCAPLPGDAEALFARPMVEQVVVLEPMSWSEFDTRWLQTIERALQRGFIRRLEILLDHKRISIQGDAWSRWKRRFKFSEDNLGKLLA